MSQEKYTLKSKLQQLKIFRRPNPFTTGWKSPTKVTVRAQKATAFFFFLSLRITF